MKRKKKNQEDQMITGVEEKAAEKKATPAAEPKNDDAKLKADAQADKNASTEATKEVKAGAEAKPAESAKTAKADVEPEKVAPPETAKATNETPAAPAASEAVKAADATDQGVPTVAAPQSELKEVLDEAKDEKEASGDKADRPTKIEPAEAHVLVVEDNVPNFVLIARLLAYMGVQRCEWKTSGWQVVEFADTLPRIDLVLMDIQLPYEDGFQALQKLRGHPRLKNTLVVAVTANASVDQMNKAKTSGFDGFLAKPLDPDKFPEQIKRVLNGEAVWDL